MDCKFGTIQVEGESIVRKFTEPSRSIHVVVSRLALEETDVRFRETAWMVMEERVGEDGAPMVVLQMCYRVHPELTLNDSGGLDETTAYFQTFILNTRGATQRTMQLIMHSKMMERFGTAASAAGVVATAYTSGLVW